MVPTRLQLEGSLFSKNLSQGRSEFHVVVNLSITVLLLPWNIMISFDTSVASIEYTDCITAEGYDPHQ